ncbi:hypothetical protein BJV82DRAFT_575998 [Fennellomyces sp. T-0311]|nr:hypothetical protein BJV82DRAFT_575998 [Fennellomyces sp. T-0311]
MVTIKNEIAVHITIDIYLDCRDTKDTSLTDSSLILPADSQRSIPKKRRATKETNNANTAEDIKRDFMDNIDTLIHCYDMDIFGTAKDKCYELVKNMLEEKRVSSWGGPWCSKLPHFGNRSTQCIEGAHWAIKLRLIKPGTFLRLYETIDVYLSTTVCTLVNIKGLLPMLIEKYCVRRCILAAIPPSLLTSKEGIKFNRYKMAPTNARKCKEADEFKI